MKWVLKIEEKRDFTWKKKEAVTLHMLEEHSRCEWQWLKHPVWGCSAPSKCSLWDCSGLNTGGALCDSTA